ncbi:unnamed protein product [Spodoptera exigua]|nr:unnamed protein product [Spodoptera exigua]
MKWFRRWFLGRFGKSRNEKTESGSSKLWFKSIGSWEHFTSFKEDVEMAEDAMEVLEVLLPVKRSEVFALTTIKNFRTDSLKDFVLESDWVILSRDQLMEPKLQRHLQKPNSLTSLCRSLAERSVFKKKAEVIAKPPFCHCNELMSSCDSEKPLRLNVFRRMINSFKRFFSLLYSNVKRTLFKDETVVEIQFINEDNSLETFSSSSMYLSAGRVRALRGGRQTRGAGAALRAYALHLAQDKSTTFAQNIDNFIACTLDSKDTSPQVMMRNMRQFMSGMKNYLVKHGEREFEKEVEKERLKLKPTEFLNLDAILEGVMHRLVVRPLRARLYTLLAAWHSADVRRLHAAIERAQHATPLQLGIKESTKVPSTAVLAVISKHFLKMQEADSPLDKLENLLAAISVMFNAIRGERSVGADDLLPVLAWTIARSRLVCAELEAELMAGLLPAALLAGEGGYYLTALFSAVAVLKRLAPEPQPDSTTPQWRRGSVDNNRDQHSVAVVRVVLPDECRGSIRRVPVPCRPGARARDLCRALAHAAAITNPQDYALFALHDGHETMLNENDCPQEVMSEKTGQNFTLAYRRIDAKIAWPQQALHSYP